MLEPYRESHLEGFVIRWVRVPCLNPLCETGLHRHGIVSLDGGPWITGLHMGDDDVRAEEDVEPLLLDVEDVLFRQAIAFGCKEWEEVTVAEIHRQVATVAMLPGPAASFMFECELEQLHRLRLVCKRGAMSGALEVCGMFGVDTGGWDGRG